MIQTPSVTEKTLSPNEAPSKKKSEVLVACRKHPIIYVSETLLALPFIGLGGYIGYIAGKHSDRVMIIFGILVILGAALSLTVRCIRFATEKLVLTTEGISGKMGLLYSATRKAPIENVQDINISNGPLGKIFHFYDVEVTTAGTGKAEFFFGDMSKAKEFQNAFIELLEERKQG